VRSASGRRRPKRADLHVGLVGGGEGDHVAVLAERGDQHAVPRPDPPADRGGGGRRGAGGADLAHRLVQLGRACIGLPQPLARHRDLLAVLGEAPQFAAHIGQFAFQFAQGGVAGERPGALGLAQLLLRLAPDALGLASLGGGGAAGLLGGVALGLDLPQQLIDLDILGGEVGAGAIDHAGERPSREAIASALERPGTPISRR
jgi:hypothetical protein